MSEPIWIPKKVCIALHARQLAEHGGGTGIRAEDLLDSALARPEQSYFYGDPKPDTCALAAAYAFGLAKNHPFVDGNKRTAFVMMRLFLLRNGVNLNAAREDRYHAMICLAAGDHTEESFATWLRENSAPVD